MVYELYSIDKQNLIKCSLNSGYEIKVLKLSPQNIGLIKAIYWNLISLGNCCIYGVYDKEQLIHTSYVIGKCYKFPFMSRKNRDIEIGPCQTNKAYRGQGIYPYVLSKIVERELSGNGVAYMIVSTENISSQKGIMKVGFRKVNKLRKDRWKRYVVDEGLEVL